MLRRWLIDSRHAARGLARSPGFTVVGVLVLGLGIGVTVALYAMVKRVLVDPLAFPDADRLVIVRSDVPGSGAEAEWAASNAQYLHFREHAGAFDDIGALRHQAASVGPRGSQTAIRARVAFATAGIHRMFGARAVVGRGFLEADDDPGAPLTAVLTGRFWRSYFGGDPDVVGRTIRIGPGVVGGTEVAVPVIGVIEPTGQRWADDPDVWLPYVLDSGGKHYNDHNTVVIARLAADRTLDGAQAEIDSLTATLPDAYPEAYGAEFVGDFMERFGFRTRLRDLKTYLVGDTAILLPILLGAAVLLLVVAWADIACLMLARVETQRSDLAVRLAVGADPAMTGRYFTAQSAFLTAASGMLGLVVAWSLGTYLIVATPALLPRLDEVAVDGGVVMFAVAVSFVVAAALAVLAAWSMRGLRASLADAGRGATTSAQRQRVRSGLIAGQVALAMILLVGAGFLIASFRNVSSVDPGIDPQGVVKVTAYPGSRYQDHASWWRLIREAQSRIEALPGVAVAGAASSMPFATGGCVVQAFADQTVGERLGASGLTSCAAQDVVTPGYFRAMGIPLLRGRTLEAADLDDPSRGSAVVSRAFADRFWPGQDPIGKRLAPHGRGEPWYTVVGLVGDVFGSSVTGTPALHAYYPLAQIPGESGWFNTAMTIAVRTGSADPAALVPEMRRILADLDPGIALEDAETMSSVLDRSTGRLGFLLVLITGAAAAALFLAMVGVYGTVSYLIAKRTNEVGVRMAFGATPTMVRRMMVAGALKLAVVGLSVGLIGSLVAGGALRGVLFGVTPANPMVYVLGALLLTLAAAAASWIASSRATRITPMSALRVE